MNRSFIESLAGSNKNGAPCGNPSQSCLPESTTWSTNANPVLAFIENEENQKSFRLIKRQLMRVLRHIFPRKLSGQVTFGVEDPYLMGQILSVAAFLYPVYGKKIDLTPVMDANALDGELSFRGRVQIGVLALMALRIWMDKNVRTQVYKYRNRGGR